MLLPICFLIRNRVAGASGGTVVEVYPGSVSADVGHSFGVNVTVLDVQNLYGLDITVDWNGAVLRLVVIDVLLGYTDGGGILYNSSATSPPFIAVNSSQDGHYEIAGTSEAPAPSFNGTGNVVELVFNVVSSGNSIISLGSELYDYPPPDRDPRISLPIDHSQINGEFRTTVMEIPDSVILLVFSVLTVFVVVLSRKRRSLLSFKRAGNVVRMKAYLGDSKATSELG